MKRCDLTKGLVFFLTIIITLCCGLIPSSWAEDVVCTNKSLKGLYGFSEKGQMELQGEGVVSYGSVGVFIADGKGNISGEETLRLGDQTIGAEFEGRYDFNENCMGTAYITTDEGLYMEITLVICGPGGNDVHMLNTRVWGLDPLAIVGIAKRLNDD